MNQRRLHIGAIFTSFDDTCQYECWNGVSAYAQQNDIDLTVYVGVFQRYGGETSLFCDTCFEMVRQDKTLDGLIVLSGFIAPNLGNEALEEYVLDLAKHIPLISISGIIPGVPSILVDNKKGTFDSTGHLIKVHGKKRIAFVSGPDGHFESERRFEGYREALEANGLEYDESYVLPGNFSKDSGRQAVELLISTHPDDFDAIIACDDETAVGVLSELKNRNIAVPMDVSVVGFDDEWFSSTFIPPITTVKQDFFEIGRTGMETLQRLIDGKQAADITYVPPEFIVRQSCGCININTSHTALRFQDVRGESECLKSYVLQGFNTLFKDIVPETDISRWAEALSGAITEKPFEGDRFLHQIYEFLLYYNNYGAEYALINDALNILTISTVRHSVEIYDAYTVRMVLIQAATLVESFKYMEARTGDFIADDEKKRLREIVNDFVLHFEITTLSDVVQETLPELNIDTVLIGLYRTPVKNNTRDADRTLETIFGYDCGKTINLSYEKNGRMVFSDYSSIESFDFGLVRRDLLFFPLFFEDDELGAMLISHTPGIPVEIYESLRTNISSAVKGTALLAKVRKLSVTDDHTGLLNRRGFFQFAYSRLQHLSRSTELVPLVLFMDMDGLKAINDTFGHKEGDAAILAFTNTVKEALREEDIIGRIGGDEFIVLSAVKAKDSGNAIVERIRKKLISYNEQGHHPYEVMASIGCVVLESCDIKSFDAAILTADNVLYEEKSRKKREGLTRA